MHFIRGGKSFSHFHCIANRRRRRRRPLPSNRKKTNRPAEQPHPTIIRTSWIQIIQIYGTVPVKCKSLIYLQCCNAINRSRFRVFSFVCVGGRRFIIGRCTLRVEPLDNACQLRLELLDFSLAQPSGDGVCSTDVLSLEGTETDVPLLCGENAGQHIIADFSDDDPIVLTIKATGSYTFGRHWHIRVTQISCDSGYKGNNQTTPCMPHMPCGRYLWK